MAPLIPNPVGRQTRDAPSLSKREFRIPIGVAVLLGTLLGSGCASTGAVPHPFPTPAPHAKTPRSPDASSAVPESKASNAEPESPIPDPNAGIANPEPRSLNPAAVDGYIIAGTALQLRGTPYRLGGADPENGFDCSGLVQYIYAQYGIAIPHDVRSQYRGTHEIDDDDIQPGDLLFFATEGNDVSHVAIAISSNQFVHSPNSKGVIRVETRKSDYWAPRYLGARRVVGLRTSNPEPPH